MSKTPVTVVNFLGRSGSGKGTQAKLLVEKFGWEYLGSGDLCRASKASGGFTGDKVGKVIDSGSFIPSAIMSMLVLDEMEAIKGKGGLKGIVVDGATRKLLEAQIFDQALQWYEWDSDVKIILIDISRQEGFDRLSNRRVCKDCGRFVPHIGEFKKLEKCDKCGGEFVKRADDTSESINARLEEFEKHTVPVIEYYEKDKRLIRINGEQSIEDVHRDIMAALNKRPSG